MATVTAAARPDAHTPGTTTLTVDDLVVEYRRDDYVIRPLDGVSLRAEGGELVVLIGPSGTGKTTLLSCLGAILTPASGRIRLGGTDVTALSPLDRQRYRREQVGFVFQSFNLIPSLSALENVAVPLLHSGRSHRDAFARARTLIDTVGLNDRASHRPAALSGGQQQRVAIARGLAGDPVLLLADEPTANLDYVQAESVIRLLRELRQDGRIVIVSSHDDRLLPVADRVHSMVAATPEPHAAALREERFTAGTSIFEQGDTSERIYEIVSGAVDIVRVHTDHSEEHLARLGAGQYFGELGPLLSFPRSASARAANDVTLTSYSVSEFRERRHHVQHT